MHAPITPTTRGRRRGPRRVAAGLVAAGVLLATGAAVSAQTPQTDPGGRSETRTTLPGTPTSSSLSIPANDGSPSCVATTLTLNELVPALYLPSVNDEPALGQLLAAKFDLTEIDLKRDPSGGKLDPKGSAFGEQVEDELDQGELAGKPVLVLTTDADVEAELRHQFRSGLPMPRLITDTGTEVDDLMNKYRGRAVEHWNGVNATELDLAVDVAGRLDSRARPAGVSVPVGGISVVAHGGTAGRGTAPCTEENGGVLALPAQVTIKRGSEAQPPVAGNEIQVIVNGEAASVTVDAMFSTTSTQPSGGEDYPSQTTASVKPQAGDQNAAPTSGAGPTQPGDGSGLPVVPIAMVVALLAAAAGGWWYLQRARVRPSPLPYGAGGAGIAPGAPSYPPGLGYPGGVAPGAPVAGVMPGGVAPAGPDAGRAVNPPAMAPLKLRPAAPGWTAAVPYDAAVRVNDLGLMRALPDDGERGRSWGWATTTEMVGAGWLEKKPDLGEDAEPTLRSHADGRGLVAVYDGVGGAGSATARRLRDGRELSGAYVAARLVRDLVETWYASVVDNDRDAGEVERLARGLAQSLQDEAEFIVETTTLRGKLSRVLPTTMAAVAYGRGANPAQRSTVADVIWAGDSRCYGLSPANGLQVLSIDDTRETDAMALIRNDQPMENLVSADRSFTLHHQRVELGSPVVLLAATDGCFGYVKTPAHFEYLLLDKLRTATDTSAWSAAVIAELGAFTRDDASFSLVAVGYEDFASLQRSFADRHAYLDEAHWAPFQAVGDDAAAVERLRDESWSAYRDLYQARMPERP